MFITEKRCLPSLSACLTTAELHEKLWFISNKRLLICCDLFLAAPPHTLSSPPLHCLHNSIWQNSYFSIYNINISVHKTQIQAFKRKNAWSLLEIQREVRRRATVNQIHVRTHSQVELPLSSVLKIEQWVCKLSRDVMAYCKISV